jgi:hypothetical protein
LLTVCATLAATASGALAKSGYTAVVTPSSAAAGATQTFNVALTNNTASKGINFAMITPPQGFTLLGASAPHGRVQLQPSKVIIRDLKLAPGSTLNASVTATAPARDPGSDSWKTQAFSNGPNSAGVFLDSGTSTLSTPVTSPQTTTSPCPATGCSVSLSTPSTSFSLDVGSGASDATVTASVDTGTPMDGPGGLNDPGCATYTPQSPDWYGFNVSATDRSKTVTWTVKDSDPNTFQVCFGAPYEFFDATGEPARAGTLPDGTRGFVGLLPNCNTEEFLAAADVAPGQSEEETAFICANISPDEENPTTTVASFTIPAGLPGDPFIGR